MLFFAGIPRRIGVGRKFYEVVTGMQSVSRNGYVPLRHEADYCLDLGRRLGVETADLSTEVFLDDSERGAAAARLQALGARAGDVLVGIHPGHGGSSPNWEPSRYAELAERLLAKTPSVVRVVVSGETAGPVFPSSSRLLDLRGRRTVRELMAVLSQLHVLVSSSTGPMHLAAALGVPTVSLFCPLPACSPELWGPQGNRSRCLLPPDGFCQGRCAGDPKVCKLQEIEIETVLEAVRAEITIAAAQKK
jgi:heptosyltransferase-2